MHYVGFDVDIRNTLNIVNGSLSNRSTYTSFSYTFPKIRDEGIWQRIFI